MRERAESRWKKLASNQIAANPYKIFDGSKISFMGIPTPNIFAGVENLHGRCEFACIDDMKKAVEIIVNIANVEK